MASRMREAAWRASRSARDDAPVDIPPPPELLQGIFSLPAAQPLLRREVPAPGVYLVGGAVRDLLLGGAPADLDLVVEGDAAAVARQLGEPRVHDRFGTSTVAADGFVYDIARARSETYQRPGALPEVAPAGLADDLARRDFTVNAMAVALAGVQAGRLHSVPLAAEDLSEGRLRILHPRSFVDDPTRLLRLARYASRLEFEVEPSTRELADAAVKAGALLTVSGSRLGAELRLLAREADPVHALLALRKLRLDSAIHPGFGLTDQDVARRALDLLPPDGRADLLVLAVAARKVPGQELGDLLDRLAFTAEDRDRIVGTSVGASDVAGRLAQAERPSEIARAVSSGGPELVALAGALGPASQAGTWLEQLRTVKLEIDGNDLQAEGIPSGPAIGQGLRAALAAKLDGEAPTRAEELSRALQAATASE
jgi:tRNA nucleotidyltransferase (CCA-adding enzyme)